MNKYLIPICDIQAGMVWIENITANSIASCREKLIDKLCNKYDWVNSYNYNEFIEFADNKDILIGSIKDIEEI